MAPARATWLAVAYGVLGLAPCARGLEDLMQNTSVCEPCQNFQPDTQGASNFNGDTSRFVRSGPGPGLLNYTLDGPGISEVQIDFFAKNSSLTGQTWLMEFRLQSDSAADPWVSVGQLRSTQDVGSAFSSVEQQASGVGSRGSAGSAEAISWTLQVAPTDNGGDWHRGRVILNALSVVNQVKGCSSAFSLEVRGQQKGVQDDLQIGKINVQPTTAEDQDICTQQIVDCPQPRSECAVNKIAPERKLSYWFDGATSLDTLDSNSNIRVADDLPEGLDSGTSSFARSDDASPGTLRYRFDGESADTGMVRMAVTILASPKGANFSDATVSVTPRVNTACDSPSATVSTLSDFDASQSLGDWSIYDLQFELGTDRTLPPLGCELPKYALIEFNAPAEHGLRIAAVRMSGIGQPAQQLESINGIADTPKQDGGILTNMLFVYIAVGIGALIVLFLLVLVWYCLGRPCCCGSSQQGHQAGNIKDKNGSLMHGQHMMRNGSNGQIMIAVDSGYPADMPHSYDDDGRFSPDKYGAHHGVLAAGHPGMHSAKMSRDIGAYSARQPGSLNGHGHAHGHGHEPVVDLALPGVYSQMRTDSGTAHTVTAPRQGQDIFDTWQQTGLGYASGDDPEMSGPLDTQAPSFTANPPISSTGNTSPTQESSVMGVTAQLGMRLNELRGMQSEHEKLARGERHATASASDNEQVPAAPEPLGVTYGKRIGVGGFGAVYEGTWSGKQVAVKVIKMPQTNKPGEEKAKMGFMEYAISGILLHDNIVQTYQADIRPVFLEDDGSEGQKSKSGWTGLGDFLSNDAVSQQLQRSMRIQEWELRLIMEYCNRGNLKEAIRNSTLQREGTACALDVALLGLDVAKGCQAIHRYNIIHGDLKPHNVLLTAAADDERGWNGKIADFGLSVKIKRGEQHVSGIQHGTEGYVAPEVLQTRRMVKASDVYSFGILMWELWHSRLYYEEHRNAVKRMRRPNLEFRPTFERHCPEEWVNLAKLCWSLKPEERPDFDRVVKMMQMIVDSIREKVDDRGIIPRPDPAELNLL